MTNEEQLDAIMAFEDGSLDAKGVLQLFSHLLQTGLVWQLQGFYGRFAMNLIEAGWLDKSGKILQSPEE